MKTDMTIEEQHKDYSNEQLINAISNTLVALERQSNRLNELNKQMAEYQNFLNEVFTVFESLFISSAVPYRIESNGSHKNKNPDGDVPNVQGVTNPVQVAKSNTTWIKYSKPKPFSKRMLSPMRNPWWRIKLILWNIKTALPFVLLLNAME